MTCAGPTTFAVLLQHACKSLSNPRGSLQDKPHGRMFGIWNHALHAAAQCMPQWYAQVAYMMTAVTQLSCQPHFQLQSACKLHAKQALLSMGVTEASTQTAPWCPQRLRTQVRCRTCLRLVLPMSREHLVLLHITRPFGQTYMHATSLLQHKHAPRPCSTPNRLRYTAQRLAGLL
jgi:hypothetical protein